MMTKQDLAKVLDKAKSLKAMVIGDAMLDRYIFGTVDRISPEAPVPILSHQRTELKAGGSANVALNLSAWGCSTSLAGLVGKDSNAKELKTILDESHIRHSLIACEDRPTTIKTRVVASSHHLLRIDEESSTYLQGAEESKMIDEVLSFIKNEKPDFIILQDYNKGMLTPDLIEKVIEYSMAQNIFLAVDPKEQNFLSYRNVDLFKPNLREASQAAKKSISVDEMPSIANQWRKDRGFHTVAITLGGQGIYIQN
ncbi:MAG: PfkB family carbohydrate kinase, partial [Saprospiraceae bacterium]